MEIVNNISISQKQSICLYLFEILKYHRFPICCLFQRCSKLGFLLKSMGWLKADLNVCILVDRLCLLQYGMPSGSCAHPSSPDIIPGKTHVSFQQKALREQGNLSYKSCWMWRVCTMRMWDNKLDSFFRLELSNRTHTWWNLYLSVVGPQWHLHRQIIGYYINMI